MSKAVLAQLALGLVSPLLLAAAAPAEPLDEALYARLLERHTRPVADTAGTRVDYRGLAQSPEWKRLVANVSRTQPAELRSRKERLAYWINVYNIFAIDLVATHQPEESIRDIGSLLWPVWKRAAGTIAGDEYSLGQIEHEILRPLDEPRIHIAIVCASISCPSLRREPWTAGRLDAQLDDGLRRFLADPDKGSRVEREAGALWLSSIFDWFAEDFASRGGVLAFLTPYLPVATRAWVELRGGELRIRHLDYDWRLNALAGFE